VPAIDLDGSAVADHDDPSEAGDDVEVLLEFTLASISRITSAPRPSVTP